MQYTITTSNSSTIQGKCMESQKKRKLYMWNGFTAEWSPNTLDSQDTRVTKQTSKVKNRMAKERNRHWRGTERKHVNSDGKSRRVKLTDEEKSGKHKSRDVTSQNILTQLDPIQRAEKQKIDEAVTVSSRGGEKRDKVQVRNSQLKKALESKKKLLQKGETSPTRRHNAKNPFHHAHASRRKRFSQLFGTEKSQRKNRDRVEKLREKKVQNKLRIASQSSLEESQSLATHSFPKEDSQEDFAQILRMIEEGTEEEEEDATSSSQPQSGRGEQKRQKTASVNGNAAKSHREDGDTDEERPEDDIPSTAPFVVMSQGHHEGHNMRSSREGEQDGDMLDTVFTELNGDDTIKESQIVTERSHGNSTSKRRFSEELMEEPEVCGTGSAKWEKMTKRNRTSYVEEELNSSSREVDERDLDAGNDSLEHTNGLRKRLHSEIETDSCQEPMLVAKKENLPSKVTIRRKLCRDRITNSRYRTSDKTVESDFNEETVNLISSSDSEDGQLVSLSDKQPSTESEARSSIDVAAAEKMEVREGDGGAKTNTQKNVPVGVNVAKSKLLAKKIDSASKSKQLSRKFGSTQGRMKASNVASQVCEFTSEDERTQNDALLKSAVDDALTQLSVITDEEDAEITEEASVPNEQANPTTPGTAGMSSKRKGKAPGLAQSAKRVNGANTDTHGHEPPPSATSLGTDVDSSLETCLPDDSPSICKQQPLATTAAVVETSTKTVQTCLKVSSKGTQTEPITHSTTTQTPITLLERNYQKFLDFFLTSRRFFEEYDQDIITTSCGSGSSTTDSETKRRADMVKEKVNSEYSDLIEGLPLNAGYSESPKVPKEKPVSSISSTKESRTKQVPTSVGLSSPLPLSIDLPGPKELKKLKKKMSKVKKKKSNKLKRAKRDTPSDGENTGDDEDISSDALRKKILKLRKRNRRQKEKKSVVTTEKNKEEVRFRKQSKQRKLTSGQKEKKVQALISKLSGNNKQSDTTVHLSGFDGDEDFSSSQETILATETNVGSESKDKNSLMEDADDGFIDYCLLPDVVVFKLQDNSTMETID